MRKHNLKGVLALFYSYDISVSIRPRSLDSGSQEKVAFSQSLYFAGMSFMIHVIYAKLVAILLKFLLSRCVRSLTTMISRSCNTV